jgi:chitin disaccharide deacetylase
VKRLIINADDFGLTEGINQVICELYEANALTSTTLMANAEQTAKAASAAALFPTLGLGCHVVLVDGVPILPASQIPTLIDPKPHGGSAGRARFRRTLGAFVTDLVRGRIRESDIEAESTAQLRRLLDIGVPLTHVDTHKHTHMFPTVLRPLLRAAVRCNVSAIRNPFEPEWSLAQTQGAELLRKIQVRLLRSQRGYFLKATRHMNLATTDGALGVLATGTLDIITLRRILHSIPDGDWELVCHPGYHDAALDGAQTRLLHSREVERKALMQAIPEAVAADPALSLIDFGQLTAARFSSAIPRYP